MQTGINSPYKGNWREIVPAKSGGVNQNTQNSGLTLRWLHSPLLAFEWGEVAVPECQPSITVVLDNRSGCQKGTEMGKLLLAKGIMLNPRGEHRTKILGRTGESDWLRAPRWRKLEGTCRALTDSLSTLHELSKVECGSREILA